jgi:phosphoribosyl-ATP pyrophosphohydrolase
MTINELINLIRYLIDENAIHKKRGFSLQESTLELAANHLIEEAVELQAEATISRNRDGIVEESADVLATWLHLLLLCGVSFDEVVDKCAKKLNQEFTFSKNEVLTDMPGFTRRNRQDDKELRALFHQLWSINVGQDKYDKQKWQKLADKMRVLTGIELT